MRRFIVRLIEQDSVRFEINVPYPVLIALFGSASIGLHTMIDEHFGITVVEIQVRLSFYSLLLVVHMLIVDSISGCRINPSRSRFSRTIT
jgi:hypothetical protein